MKFRDYFPPHILFAFIITVQVACTKTEPAISPIADTCQQIILVITPDFDQPHGTLRRFQRQEGSVWQPVGDEVDIVLGRNGLAWGSGLQPAQPTGPQKREGDGRSPAGVFALSAVFGFAPPEEVAGLKMPYIQVTDSLECIDDVKSEFYNQLQDRRSVPEVDWRTSEKMHDIAQYHLGVIVDQNAARTAGGGSCIFLHIWGGPQATTSGCTAMQREQLQIIVNWLDAAAAPILVQLPAQEYQKRLQDWRLP